MKSRMREIRTYGSVRGDRHSSHINKGKGVSSCLLDTSIMTYKNGIYLSTDGDNAVWVIIENNTKIQTDETAILDELIGELEYNLCYYETVVEHILEQTEPLDGIGAYAEEQLQGKVLVEDFGEFIRA